MAVILQDSEDGCNKKDHDDHRLKNRFVAGKVRVHARHYSRSRGWVQVPIYFFLLVAFVFCL